MTTEAIMKMTAEEFATASTDDKMEAIGEVITSYTFEKEWLENHNWYDKRDWEYRMHKRYMLKHRERICSWLNAIGIETLPFKG